MKRVAIDLCGVLARKGALACRQVERRDRCNPVVWLVWKAIAKTLEQDRRSFVAVVVVVVALGGRGIGA